MSVVGGFGQQTIYPAANVARPRQKQLVDAKVFASQLQVGRVYAAFASYAERGERKYWLLRAKSQAKTGETIKVPGGRTIAKNQWSIKAQWYLSTSDDQGRKSYKLLPEEVHIPVACAGA